jgi:hypothetical protein
VNPATGQPPEGSSAGITNICRTVGVPPKINEPFVDYHGKMIPLVDSAGVYCRVCHFLPVKDAGEDTLNTEHRTQSIDFGVVLQGEIELTLDDGVKKTMRKGDVVVQRGTIHVGDVTLDLTLSNLKSSSLLIQKCALHRIGTMGPIKCAACSSS